VFYIQITIIFLTTQTWTCTCNLCFNSTSCLF